MTLEEAIRVKENYLKLHSHELYKEIIEADRLGIETLRFFEKCRHGGCVYSLEPLPGETKQ